MWDTPILTYQMVHVFTLYCTGCVQCVHAHVAFQTTGASKMYKPISALLESEL